MNPSSQPPHQIMHPPKRHLPLPPARPPFVPSPGDYHRFSSSGRVPDHEADEAVVVKSPVSLLWGSVCLGVWNWKLVGCWLWELCVPCCLYVSLVVCALFWNLGRWIVINWVELDLWLKDFGVFINWIASWERNKLIVVQKVVSSSIGVVVLHKTLHGVRSIISSSSSLCVFSHPSFWFLLSF